MLCSGKATFAGTGVYSCSKACIQHMAKIIAAEEAIHGVRVNVVSPGYIVSDMLRDFLSGQVGKDLRYVHSIIRERFGS